MSEQPDEGLTESSNHDDGFLPSQDREETIGELHARLPASGAWLYLPEYGVRARKPATSPSPPEVT
jgi:hypothetical protein